MIELRDWKSVWISSWRKVILFEKEGEEGSDDKVSLGNAGCYPECGLLPGMRVVTRNAGCYPEYGLLPEH